MTIEQKATELIEDFNLKLNDILKPTPAKYGRDFLTYKSCEMAVVSISDTIDVLEHDCGHDITARCLADFYDDVRKHILKIMNEIKYDGMEKEMYIETPYNPLLNIDFKKAEELNLYNNKLGEVIGKFPDL